ncbi:MAG: FAD-dependent oxidoreductase [Oleiphilaceae bacterium]|nr:FAD-dependent oxidoreductase [Oleiphilaceae bacterium]
MSASKPIVIVGTGLAGYSLAREFRKLNKDTPLVLITRDDGHSYSKPMLSTGFTKQKDADALSMGDPGKMAEQLQADIRIFTEVSAINTDEKTLDLGGETIEYDKLVLASGAKVNRLEFPGSHLDRVVSINDLMDYRRFRQLVAGKQHILIMGAGLIGCEYANDLREGGYEVTIVDPSETPLNGLIPPFAGEALQQGLVQAGVAINMGKYVVSITETGDHLCAELNDGTTIDCDVVISAIGLKPDLHLAEQAGITCARGIITDRTLQTSAKDVYAIGDAAEVAGLVLLYVLPLMACARALARTLNGEITQVSYGVMPVVTKTPACPVVVAPPVRPSGSWQIVEKNGIHIKALFIDEQEQPLGFVLTGDCTKEKQSLSKTVPNLLV